MGYLRRRPGTWCYLAVLLATHLVIFHMLSDDGKRRVLAGISTDLSAMDWSSPVRLLASGLVVDTSGGLLNIALVVVLGIAACLGWLEYRLGSGRAFLIFAAAHVVASLFVLVIVAVAVRTGRYPDEVTREFDYGVSYGALGAIGAVTWLVPAWARLPWAMVAVLYPLTAADWYGWLPDYSSIGHVSSAVIGLGVAAYLLRERNAAARARAASFNRRKRRDRAG